MCPSRKKFSELYVNRSYISKEPNISKLLFKYLYFWCYQRIKKNILLENKICCNQLRKLLINKLSLSRGPLFIKNLVLCFAFNRNIA